ncbi:MAG TPA: SpoIID/LytB domain-containing protein [Gemmatimonadales bacterium]|nr:SpoIID/LytB domain-containing protein [Gemmatimonadales bacterium]
MRARSRWQLASLIAAAAAACAHPSLPALGTEPELRVGLETDQTRVAVGGDGELVLTDDANGSVVGSIPSGTAWTAIADPAGLRLVRPDGSRSEPHPGVFAVDITEGRYVMVDGRRYRGRLDVVRQGTGLLVVNRVPLESYVASVIAAELGPRRADERAALLAQAVVSRSFAVKNRGHWEGQGVDVFADTRDQVYPGVATESPQAWDATRATAGEVLAYHGGVIDAFFHSTCGARTAAVEEVFQTAVPQPYLRSVSDASGGGHFYCDLSPHFQWREEWDGLSLRAILTRTLPAIMSVGGDGLPRVTDLQVTRTTPSGRVGELRIVFDHGDIRVPGPMVRAVLRPELDRLLGSQAFRLAVTREGGLVTRVVATGTGWGHGVGFCQWGAVGRARAGQSYSSILSTYYPGTALAHLY